MLTEDELNNLIICKKCHTLHEKIPLRNQKAFCSNCNILLYQHKNKMIEKTLALVIAAAISLLIAFKFTIVTINIQGLQQSLTLDALFYVLAEHHQYVVGLMFIFLIVIFPITIISAMLLLLILMKLKRGGYLTKRLLILLAHIRPWSMVDIFFISLLVSMVKLFDYANIELGVAFIAFIFTLILDIIITKNISFYELWEQHRKIYGVVNE
jgi:paraquat-inducible protein A